MRAGKPIATALRDHYVTRHMADPAAVEREIGAMVTLNIAAGGGFERHDMSDGDMLSGTDDAMCKKMGMDPKKFAEHRKKLKMERAAEGRA
jgi:hypothetical protein